MSSRTSRREWARALAAAAVAPRLGAAGSDSFAVRNDAIEFSMSLSKGKVVSRRFRSSLTGEALELPAEDIAVEFEGCEVLLPSSARAEVLSHSGNEIQIEFRRDDVVVRVRYTLRAGKHYLRKQVSVRRTDRQRRLLRADLDNWMGVRRHWQSMTADRLKFGSHPIYCETLFAGVEFVAAFNQYTREGFVLRSRPGGIEVGEEWVDLNSTVIGVSQAGAVREAFLEYLEDVRLAPAKLAACYNSWWTLPTVVKQQDNLNLIRTLKEELHDRHGVFFDIVTTDMGWSNPRSIWEIDREQLPHGFDDIRGIVETADARLGLWMSPSETYPPACDYEWLETQGYVVLRRNEQGKRQAFALSLADPKYRGALKAQLPKLIQGNNLGHIKYDGFVAEETVGHHELLPGADSVEPLARYSLELLEVSKQARANLVTEPTYMNSLANYISPWILKYSDSVWGNSGSDCPPGLNPAPDYRESHTNAREYYIFSSLREFWLPQNAVQYFDIVHCDQATGFPNHAAMAFGRGRFFLSTYLNPTFMTGDDWRIYAGLLKWARANQEILRNTVVMPSRVEAGEPYVYAHWLGERGILVVRNPSNATQVFALDLRAARAPKSLRKAICYTQYPYRRGIAREIRSDSTIQLMLAPWELLFLEMVPEERLQEPVAIGARWYKEGGETRLVADPATDAVQWLEPHSAARSIHVAPRPALELRGRIVSQSAHQLPQNEWLTMKSGPVPSSSFEIECEVSIPKDVGGGRLLLLVEYPGTQYWPSRCDALLNSKPVALTSSSSLLSDDPMTGHIGFYYVPDVEPWKKVRQYESHWNWYGCSVPAGSSRVRFSGAAGFEQPRIGIWLWSEQNIAKLAQLVDCASSAPAMPEYRSDIERGGICIRASSRIAHARTTV